MHETFHPDAPYRGQVLLRADGLEWYVHKDILWFSAPFFPRRKNLPRHATPLFLPSTPVSARKGVRNSVAKVPILPCSSPPSMRENEASPFSAQTAVAHSTPWVLDTSDRQPINRRRRAQLSAAPTPTCSHTPLEPPVEEQSETISRRSTKDASALGRAQPPTRACPKRESHAILAVTDLPDECALTVQEFLLFIYPHTRMDNTWLSVGRLLAFSDKVGNAILFQEACNFLRQSLAGRPIEALCLAERHHLPNVYREASRHVLDHWSNWDRDEVGDHDPAHAAETGATQFLVPRATAKVGSLLAYAGL